MDACLIHQSRIISSSKLLFWDFDGVIKDSVELKSQAFVKLFQVYGDAVSQKVRIHQESNGGMSRFDKLPIYLKWAGEEPSQHLVDKFVNQFGQLVLQAVIEAPWVPGADIFLRNNPHKQAFVLISATPQEELGKILEELELTTCFVAVFGSPIAKKEAIAKTLATHSLDPQDCLMLGDSKTDLEAAEVNGVPFMLRMHKTNKREFLGYIGPAIKDFIEL